MSDSLQRITSIIESAKDLTLAASAKLAETPTHLRPKEVSSLLNSRAERDVLKGLKYIISLLSSGKDASQFFADVVKNVTSSNLKIRKLVYTYLLRYADRENDLALLSINAIQKSLGDKNDQVRALAIRVMSDIKIPSIYPIVLLGIKKAVSDNSPYVRKAATASLIKIFVNHKSAPIDEIHEHLKRLLRDRDPGVLSSALLTFKVVCPDNYELLHGHFRRFCSIIMTLDEWAQIYLVEIFTTYARKFLRKPRIIDAASSGTASMDLPEIYNEIPFPVYDVEFDPDLELFIQSIKRLIFSRNDAVVVAVARALFHLTPPKTFKESQVSASLIRVLLTSTTETQSFVLQTILYMAIHDHTLFVQYEKRFYILSDDPYSTAQFKLKILSVICNDNNIKSILNELQHVTIRSSDPRIAIEALGALGICSQISAYWSSKILKWLINQILSRQFAGKVTNECLTVIRYLIQQDQKNNIKTVLKLARSLDDGSLVADAKQSVTWLVGEFTSIQPKIGPEVLRKLLKNIAFEEASVRYQIILLAAKVYSNDLENYKSMSGDCELINYNFNGRIAKMFSHAINLGRYDDDNDIRDRSRMLHTLLSSPETQLATLMLQAPKPVPVVTLKSIGKFPGEWTTKDDDLTSLSVSKIIKEYNNLPDWCDVNHLLDSSERDEILAPDNTISFSRRQQSMGNSSKDSTPVISHKPATKSYKLQSLDDFFADTSASKPIVPKKTKKTIIIEESDSSSEDVSSSSEESSEEAS